MKAKQEDVIKKRQLQLAKKDAQARLIEKEKERKKKKEQQKVNIYMLISIYKYLLSKHVYMFSENNIQPLLYLWFLLPIRQTKNSICKNVFDAIFKSIIDMFNNSRAPKICTVLIFAF